MSDANVENLRVMAAVFSTQTIHALLEAWRRGEADLWRSWIPRSPTRTTTCLITLAWSFAATRVSCGPWKPGRSPTRR